MSSMIASYPFASETYWARSDCESKYTASDLSHATHSEEVPRNTWFTGGLPTPPGRTMNGVSIGSSLPAFPPNHSCPPMHPSSDKSSFQQRPVYSSQNDGSYLQQARVNGTTGPAIVQSDKSATNMIAAHLQIPESVNKSKGSLAEFAAEITCLFWFESSNTLEYAENLPQDAFIDRGLSPDAIPSTGFRKWVTTILSTTQVGKNVILLALMFIYRLNKFNPSVSGKRGSEFRLLTIALMLGNKFLDDNTYTNKTWAEVSGISVTEIHIMEVEFLSNMRYDLYVSESEWKEWKSTLGRLGSFYEKALKYQPRELGTPVTPLSQNFVQKLPSPPSTHHSQQPFILNGLNQKTFAGLPNPAIGATHLPPSPLRQQRVPSVDMFSARKRSLDMGSEQLPAKRLHLLPAHVPNAGLLTPSPYSSHGSGSASVPPMSFGTPTEAANNADGPRLPIPRLAVPITSVNSNQLAPLSLPSSRAMSSVYPTTTAWSQPITPVSAVPSNLFQSSIPNLGDLSRPHSNVASAHTSPVGYGTNSPALPGLSPSYFLTNRSSPYRPVRNVNTLVIPPPPGALQNSVRNIDHDQIRYQPLSKVNTERRTGPIPVLHPEGWQASNASTPIQQRWPYRF